MTVMHHHYLDNIEQYVPGSARKSLSENNIDDIVKLSSNENPFGSPLSPSSYNQLLSYIHEYPDLATSKLPSILSKKLGVSQSNIIYVNGSDELLQLISLAYLDTKSKILSIAHTFSQYKFMSQISGSKYHELSLNINGYINVDDLLEKIIDQKIQCVCLASPNNPTGVSFSFAEILRLLSSIPEDVLFVLDQAYIEFDENYASWDIAKIISNFPNVLIMRTFSKAYGLAGARIGYGIANDQICTILNKVKQPFNVNAFAIKAAEFALSNQSFFQKTISNNFKQKQLLYESFNELGISYFKSSANFVCIKLPFDSKNFVNFLKKNYVLVRPLHSFGLPCYLRVSIGLDYQNQKFIDLLKEYLKNHV